MRGEHLILLLICCLLPKTLKVQLWLPALFHVTVTHISCHNIPTHLLKHVCLTSTNKGQAPESLSIVCNFFSCHEVHVAYQIWPLANPQTAGPYFSAFVSILQSPQHHAIPKELLLFIILITQSWLMHSHIPTGKTTYATNERKKLN